MRLSRVLTIAFAATIVVFALFAVATVGAQADESSSLVTHDGRPMPVAVAESSGPFVSHDGRSIPESSGPPVTHDGRPMPVDGAVPTEAIAPAAPVIGVETPEAVAVPEGFSWTDAGIGAAVAVGGMIVMLLLAGAALSLRWHEPPWHWHHGATPQ